MRDAVDDTQRCEQFVPVEWIQTVPLDQAFNDAGLFGNQTTVCATKMPKWRRTVDRLRTVFQTAETE